MSTRLHDERMMRFLRAGLYLVTSQEYSRGRSTPDIVRQALAGGVRLIQLREKSLSAAAVFRMAIDVRRMTDAAGALLLINDRVDVALACGADGVHLGRDDLPVREARRLAPDLIVGATTHGEEDVRDAEEQGASYVNVGPVFETPTKKEWSGRSLGVGRMREIAGTARLPFTVMGGIQRRHVPELVAAGARTLAVVSAVTAAADPAQAAADLMADIRQAAGEAGRGARRT